MVKRPEATTIGARGTRARSVAPPFEDPGEPDTRGPARYLLWLARRQISRVGLGSLWSTLWMAGLMLPPYLIEKAIDEGLLPKHSGALALFAGLIIAVGVLTATLGLFRHRVMTFIRLDGSYRTMQVVTRKVAELGATLPLKVSTGGVVSIGAADISRITATLTATGPGVGAILSYALVAILLFNVSALLAIMVLLGVPVILVTIGPLLGKLRTVESLYRDKQGELTARAGDIVSGLRVLTGLGGKEAFFNSYVARSRALMEEGFRVGAVTSWIGALGVGLPGLFLAAVTFVAARMAAEGAISVGQLVAVYGYGAALVVPVSVFIECGGDLTRGLVAAERVIRVLSLEPALADCQLPLHGPSEPGALQDPDSGLNVPAGSLLALACSQPENAVAIAERLGRYVESAATWSGLPLSLMALSEIRRRVVVADHDAYIFAGSLRDVVAGATGCSDEVIECVLEAAAASEIVSGLPTGVTSNIEAEGRNLSGGQRQRLRLARALATGADILILLEPSSAVDVHTEAVMAQRLRLYRAGLTTVVASTSPIVLGAADQVAFVTNGRVVAQGPHAGLLTTVPAYRELVYRGVDTDERPSGLPASTNDPGRASV